MTPPARPRAPGWPSTQTPGQVGGWGGGQVIAPPPARQRLADRPRGVKHSPFDTPDPARYPGGVADGDGMTRPRTLLRGRGS